MNIALVGPVYPYRGGIAHYTALFAQHLRQRHSVRLYSFKQQYPRWLFPGRSQHDPGSSPVSALAAHHWLIPWWPPTWAQVQRDWATWQPDVVIIQWWVPFMAAMTASLTHTAHQVQSRVVMLCHNVLPHERAGWDKPLVRWALHGADRLVMHSTRDQAKARQLLPTMPTRVVALPSYGALRSTTHTREQAQTTLGLTGRVILFFGFVRPYKGLMDLLNALPSIDNDIRLLVVGEIWGDAEPYHACVLALGLQARVQFVDRYVTDEEAALYFAAADLAVLPYRSATGSAVLQLAFGLGVPVVATRTGGMDEAVDDGVTGFLVDPGDVAGLANAIRRFFDENRAADFRAAIQRQAGRFSWAAAEAAVLDGLTNANL